MALRRAFSRSFSSICQQYFNKPSSSIHYSQCSWLMLQHFSCVAGESPSSTNSPQFCSPSTIARDGLGYRGFLYGVRILDGSLQWGDGDGGSAMQQLMSSTAAVRAFSLATAGRNVGAASSGGLVHAGGFNLNEVAVQKAAHIGYTVVGRLDGGSPFNIEPQEAFAVIQIGSHQFKVTPGDCIYTEKLKFADINDKLRLNKVLLVGTKDQSVIGRPIVPSSAVFAVVEEHALDAKVIIFKKKRRKNYRRTRGHRQELTRLRITNIEGLELSSHSEPEPLQLVENQ